MSRRRACRAVHGRRSGATIVLALGALVILGLVMAALTTLVISGSRDAVTAGAMDEAQVAADNAIATVRSTWSARAEQQARDGEVATVTVGDLVTRTGARLLPSGVVRVAAEGSTMGATVPSARARRASLFYLRRRPPVVTTAAALIIVGPTVVEAGAEILGAGAAPPSGCPVDSIAGAGVLGDDLAHLLVDTGAIIDGVPALDDGAAPLVADVMTAIATLSGPSLMIPAPLPSIVFAPREAAGRCALDDTAGPGPINAGAPTGACGGYRPYVRVGGDLVTPTGQGQGILYVDGDLRVAGNFRWTGLVIVTGALQLDGPDAELQGMIVATGGVASSHRIGGSVRLVRSSCAVRQVLVASARVTPLTGASWAGLP